AAQLHARAFEFKIWIHAHRDMSGMAAALGDRRLQLPRRFAGAGLADLGGGHACLPLSHVHCPSLPAKGLPAHRL
ncbi:MAG: hypothetical protein K9K30_16070, partial [Burkholderiaceae bacterium]|nr:hypothetical protein [Burkholderiaceae bacterium]